MTDAIVTTRPEAQLLTAAEAAGIQLSAMLDAIPEADSDAYVGILAQIASAQDVSQLDAPWELGSLQKYVDTWLEVRSVKRMASDFADGLGFYLVVEAKVTQTGEIVTLSTGSVNIVAQLAKAVQLDALPLMVCPRLARKPSRNGYKPMHLEVAKS